MNLNSPFSKLYVVLTAGVLLLAAFGALSLVNIGSETESYSEAPLEEASVDNSLNSPPATGTRAGSPRTVLAELFTNWDCGPCVNANPPINELCDVYGPSQLVMIAYHTDWPGSDDPYNLYNPTEVQTRVTDYSVTGVPSMFFDGPPNRGHDGATTYSYYKGYIDSELATTSPVTITLEGYLNMMTMNGYVNVTIEVTDTLPIGTLLVKSAVTEDNGYAAGSNGEVRHRNIFRDMLAQETLPAMVLGETHTFSRSFVIDWSFNLDNIQVVVFLQNDSDDSVLQAAMYDFIPQRILVVDDDQSTNPDGKEDYYQEVLSFMGMGFAFDSHVYNEVGTPSVTLLNNYEVVLWLTSDTSSDTLNAADQTAISSYLDGGLGSLFMCGQNIGSDIGATPFYQNYLHSTFVTADTDENTIEGVAGDPISDPFVGSSLQISADSPSEIAPIAPASTSFVYLPSGDPAAVRADHDIDSKVVYMACMYFEHIDIIDTKAMVMMQVLWWLTDMYHRIELSPGMNLLSIPAEQFDTSIDTVLDSIAGYYDSVSFYNSSQDDWKHDHSSKPVSLNDLTDLHHHMGIWIHVTTPGDTVYTYPGMDLWQSQMVHLYPGWNLVGYPSQNEYDRTTGLNNLVYGTDVECVQTFDATLQQWVDLGPSDNFELGKGYWIYSNSEQDWEVPV